MTVGAKAALLVSGLALLVVPAVALAAGAPSNPGAPDNQGTQTAAANRPNDTSQPGPNASLPTKAKAYGRYCQTQSKKHVAGQKGTPFSQCVTAMAKLASGTTASPRTACAAMSKKHVSGQKGTPFSNCVSSGAKLLKDKHKSP
jgi:hypothetical protein